MWGSWQGCSAACCWMAWPARSLCSMAIPLMRSVLLLASPRYSPAISHTPFTTSHLGQSKARWLPHAEKGSSATQVNGLCLALRTQARLADDVSRYVISCRALAIPLIRSAQPRVPPRVQFQRSSAFLVQSLFVVTGCLCWLHH